jgi:hypothetical protein
MPASICARAQVSKVLVTYGKHVLSLGPVAEPYNEKYKGTWVCLQVGPGLLWHGPGGGAGAGLRPASRWPLAPRGSAAGASQHQ